VAGHLKGSQTATTEVLLLTMYVTRNLPESLFQTLQLPSLWKPFASALSDAMYNSNSTALRDFLLPPTSVFNRVRLGQTGQSDLSRLAVSCADAPRYRKNEKLPTPEGMASRLERIRRETSPTFGATVAMMEQHGGCQFWPESDKPAERFDGPWNTTLANPVLIMSNVYDPITPAISGEKMSALYGNMSRHVVTESFGHSYLAWPQRCWSAVLTDYFERGIFPKDGHLCRATANETNVFRDYKP
jgi:pimeloyl-ACP methyl ester carboxylesterase